MTQQFIATADFNGDGKIDLVTSSFSSSSFGLLIGAGNGEFEKARRIALSAAPDYIATADFNRDGKSDILCVSFTAGSVTLFLGSGKAPFAAPKTFSAGSGVRAAA